MSDGVWEGGAGAVTDDDLEALLDALVAREGAAGWDAVGDVCGLQPWQYTDEGLLGELAGLQRGLARVQARCLALLAEAEKREATLRVTGLPTASWLTDRNSHWAGSAREEVRLAVRLDQQPLLRDAFAAGALSLEQVRVISTGIDRLPPGLDPDQRAGVEAHLVELGHQFGPYGLSRLGNRAVEVVAPEIAEDADRRAVERVEAEQRRTRYLSWGYDPDGALLLRGKLPTLEGQNLVGVLRALAVSHRNAAALAGIELDKGRANADALLTLAEHHTRCPHTDTPHGARPRVLVQVDYDTLLGRLGTATLPDTGHRISAHQARVLACDAGILPVVMGERPVPLDVGRERRLFTGTLRALLTARDHGCAFPGCDRPAADCDAHHITPWHAGGATSLDNGVLLCPFHHHLIEPDPTRPTPTQWVIRLDPQGRPQFGSPTGHAAPPGQRRWRQHHRYRT